MLFGMWNFTIKRIVDHVTEQKKISQFLAKSIKFIEVQDLRNLNIFLLSKNDINERKSVNSLACGYLFLLYY